MNKRLSILIFIGNKILYVNFLRIYIMETFRKHLEISVNATDEAYFYLLPELCREKALLNENNY